MRFSLLAHAACDPIAFGEAGSRTAADLLRDAEAIATNVPEGASGSEVLVACGDRYLFAACLVAAWLRGHAVALPPNVQPRSIDEVSSRPNVRALLHDTDAAIGVDVRKLVFAEAASTAGAIPTITFEGDRHVATIFTSGSTGAPRACMKTAAHLIGEAHAHARTTCREMKRVIATVPAIHIYGLLFSVLVPFARGAAFSRETPLHAPTVAAALQRFDADTLVTVPAHLRALESLDPGNLASSLQILSSGAALPEDVAAMLDTRFGLNPTEILGSSETGGIATRTRANDPWRPLEGVHVSAGADGTLRLTSPFTSDVRTADRIVMEATGTSFRHLGRKDSVVKIASKRVDLEDMQRRLQALAGVTDAAVFRETNESARGATIYAAIAADPAKWTTSAVRAALSQYFDPVVVPRRILVVDALPREDNGKLRRDRVRALFDPPPRSLELDVRPRSREDKTATFDVHVPEDLVYFQGHFEGDPILAGVVQLDVLVRRRVAMVWPELTHLRKVARLRFRRPIRPNDDVVLTLTRADEARVRFELRLGDIAATDGSLHFERTPA